MNFTQILATQLPWTLALFGLAVGVFSIPLLPALVEMLRKRPYVLNIDRQDDGSSAYAAKKSMLDAGEAVVTGDMHIQPGRDMGTTHCTGYLFVAHHASVSAAQAQHIFLQAGSTVREVAAAVQTLTVQPDCQFAWLDAQTVCFIAAGAQEAAGRRKIDDDLPLSALQQSGTKEKFVRIEGSWQPAPRTQVRGDCVVTQDVYLARECQIFGNIKAYGNVKLGAYSCVHGSVFADGSIEISPSARVFGVVSSAHSVVLHQGSVVGHIDQLSSVSAPHIVAHAGALVHGSVRASTLGQSKV